MGTTNIVRVLKDTSLLPFAQQQRLRFIESMVLWEGAVQRQRVCDVFRVNPNHVTRDIQIYKKWYPKSLEYNPSVRAYEAGAQFVPQLASGDSAEYLSLLHAYAESHSVAMLPVIGGAWQLIETLPSPKCTVDQHVLRSILQATRHSKGIQATYSSMSSDKPKSRILWPHALVHTGLHWHIRAYDSLASEFRNFAIQRISEVTLLEQEIPLSPDHDSLWRKRVKVEVIPNSRLNNHQQEIVAKEYGMTRKRQEWIWSAQIRQCLVGYFAFHYRLDVHEDKDPQCTPLVIKDRKMVESFLFRQNAIWE